MIERIEVEHGRVRVTTDLISEADVKIFYYCHYIRRDSREQNFADSAYLASLSSKELKIDVVEGGPRPLSGWPEIVDIIVTFVSLRLVEGFFSEIGSEVFQKMKNKLKMIAANSNNKRVVNTGMHLVFDNVYNNKNIKVKVALRVEDIDQLGKEPFDMSTINKFLSTIFSDIDYTEVLITRIDEFPFWRVVHFFNGKVYTKISNI